jgi:hypothetical protein
MISIKFMACSRDYLDNFTSVRLRARRVLDVETLATTHDEDGVTTKVKIIEPQKHNQAPRRNGEKINPQLY